LLLSKQLPQSFLESLQGIKGYDMEPFVEAHDQARQVTCVRLNPAKQTSATATLPIDSVVPWCPAGRYLSERPSFTLDPVFHGGAYYVQEASSMFLDYILTQIYKDEKVPDRVLDLCAAPGGKSTLLAAGLTNSFIVSNEVIKTRVTILAENISKWGSDNVIVTNNDPRDFKNLPGYFDLIVVDAPCSGSGLFRKDSEAINEWSEANVTMCSQRQQRILADAIPALKQNGYLIYSTCSYSLEEDEMICDWIVDELDLEPVEITVDEAWGIVQTLSPKHNAAAYRFYPDKVKGEGFFIACFQQKNMADEYYGYQTNLPTATKQILTIASPFLHAPQDYILSDQKEIVVASLKKWEEEYVTTAKVLNVRKSGVAVGTVKGKDLIPHHELALSQLLSPSIPVIQLDYENALKYLRRQDLSSKISGKGWTICRYEDINIGWVKVLPNRVNNYYPTNWRILKL
jgi:NOL1/NOP2/sun family putative RNA methylase